MNQATTSNRMLEHYRHTCNGAERDDLNTAICAIMDAANRLTAMHTAMVACDTLSIDAVTTDHISTAAADSMGEVARLLLEVGDALDGVGVADE